MISEKNFEVYFDCGSSKIRAGAFNKENPDIFFYKEGKSFFDHSNIDSEIQRIITSLEVDTEEYLNDVNLMIDSSEMLSINISLLKKLDGSKLIKEDIQFLVQDAKQQILKNYIDQEISHIIIKRYNIDNIDYNYLPNSINCNIISLDILFICIPKKIVEYYKEKFSKLDISVKNIFCSSYAKSSHYITNFTFCDDISFIDIGFNKTSIISYFKNEITFFDVIPIGGNHVTKDLCSVLKLDVQDAENLKLFIDKDSHLSKINKIPINLIQEIIFARTEELLKLCTKSINLNTDILNNNKIILIGEGSKIFNNKFLEKISFSQEFDLFQETLESICMSAYKLGLRLNKQEVVTVPKKHTKQGIFEKFFHFFS